MSDDENTSGTVKIIVAVIGGVAVIAAAVITSMKGCEVTKPQPPVVLEINQPSSGKPVMVTTKPNDAAAYFPVNGTLSGSPPKPNLEICAVVYDKAEWWLQDCVPAKEGTWNLEAWVGGEDNKPQSGQKNKIRAVLADIDTVENFKKTKLGISENAKEINPVVSSINAPEFELGSLTKK